MKKRILMRVILLVLVISLSALLAGCGHQHAYGSWKTETEPNCTTSGIKVRVCECGEKETEILPAKGHIDGAWVTDIEATCTESGSRHLTCTVCAETTKTEPIAAKGHTEGEWVTDAEATCTGYGNSHLTCSVCAETIMSATIGPKGHTVGEWITHTEANCTESGKRYLVCSDCSETIKVETIAAKGHKDGKWIVDENATCTENGSRHQLCSVCSETIKTESIAAKGHKDGKWIVDKNATCSAAGSKHQVCSVCNATLKTESIPATGKHDYSGKTTTEPSCASSGVKTFTCSGCGNSYTETIPCKTYSATEIYENHLVSVGEVTTYDMLGNIYSIGTCFVYSSDGKLITNYHVIENAFSATVTLGNTQYQVQQVLAYDKTIDLAVLKISANNLLPVKLCEQNHKVGQAVYTLGSAQGLTATFSDGMITYSNRNINGVSYIQHDAPISAGNSGGPLINKYGEVIGINTWTVKESQNLNFAICVSELRKLNYGTPLTMAQLYLKESNAFTRLKNYIVKNGTYYTADNCYALVTGIDYSDNDDTEFERRAYYYPESDIITLDMLIDGGSAWAYFEIDNTLSGVYHWEYFDEYDHEMYGTLYAATYDDNTLLEYSDHNLPNASLRDTIRRLSSLLISSICFKIDSDFFTIFVFAKDLQFFLY